jgi:hypothetical protein
MYYNIYVCVLQQYIYACITIYIYVCVYITTIYIYIYACITIYICVCVYYNNIYQHQPLHSVTTQYAVTVHKPRNISVTGTSSGGNTFNIWASVF